MIFTPTAPITNIFTKLATRAVSFSEYRIAPFRVRTDHTVRIIFTKLQIMPIHIRIVQILSIFSPVMPSRFMQGSILAKVHHCFVICFLG